MLDSWLIRERSQEQRIQLRCLEPYSLLRPWSLAHPETFGLMCLLVISLDVATKISHSRKHATTSADLTSILTRVVKMTKHVALKLLVIRKYTLAAVHKAGKWCVEPRMETSVAREVTRGREALAARAYMAYKRLLARVGVHVVFERELALEPTRATRVCACEWAVLHGGIFRIRV
jgi:hypothetical protein